MAWWTSTQNSAVHPKTKSKFVVVFGSNFFLPVVKSITKPKVEIDTKEFRLINHTFNYPGNAKWQPVTIKFVDMNGDIISNDRKNVFDTSSFLWLVLNNTGYTYPYHNKSNMKSKFLSNTGKHSLAINTNASISSITTPEKSSNIANSFGKGLTGQADYGAASVENQRITIYQISGGDLRFPTPPERRADPRASAKKQVNNGVKIVECWHLINPIVKSINWGDLDYGSDDLVEYELQVVYDWAVHDHGRVGDTLDLQEKPFQEFIKLFYEENEDSDLTTETEESITEETFESLPIPTGIGEDEDTVLAQNKANITFETNKSDLDEAGESEVKEAFNRAITQAREADLDPFSPEFGTLKINIQTGADKRGTDADNQKLTEDRAEEIQQTIEELAEELAIAENMTEEQAQEWIAENVEFDINAYGESQANPDASTAAELEKDRFGNITISYSAPPDQSSQSSSTSENSAESAAQPEVTLSAEELEEQRQKQLYTNIQNKEDAETITYLSKTETNETEDGASVIDSAKQKAQELRLEEGQYGILLRDDGGYNITANKDEWGDNTVLSTDPGSLTSNTEGATRRLKAPIGFENLPNEYVYDAKDRNDEIIQLGTTDKITRTLTGEVDIRDGEGYEWTQKKSDIVAGLVNTQDARDLGYSDEDIIKMAKSQGFYQDNQLWYFDYYYDGFHGEEDFKPDKQGWSYQYASQFNIKTKGSRENPSETKVIINDDGTVTIINPQ